MLFLHVYISVHVPKYPIQNGLKALQSLIWFVFCVYKPLSIEKEIKNGVVRESDTQRRERSIIHNLFLFTLYLRRWHLLSVSLHARRLGSKCQPLSFSLFLCPMWGRAAGNRLPCWLKAAFSACVLSVKDRRTIRARGRDRHRDDS